jgi:hypothetical protein
LPWLEREFGWTDDTALNFMRVANLAESRNFRDLNVPISGLCLLAAPSTPDAAREEIVEGAKDGKKVTLALGDFPCPSLASAATGARALGASVE